MISLEDADDVFDDLELDDDERYLLTFEPQPKLDTYNWFEYGMVMGLETSKSKLFYDRWSLFW